VKYYIQFWDTDTESWEDVDLPASNDRYEAEEEARNEVRKCAYKIKWRLREEP
jgi:hypothetical protein